MNIDDRLRQAERILADPELPDIALLSERLRLGRLKEERVRAAARLGEPRARLLFPREEQRGLVRLRGLKEFDFLSRGEDELLAADFAEEVLPFFEEVFPEMTVVRDLIESRRFYGRGSLDRDSYSLRRYRVLGCMRVIEAALVGAHISGLAGQVVEVKRAIHAFHSATTARAGHQTGRGVSEFSGEDAAAAFLEGLADLAERHAAYKVAIARHHALLASYLMGEELVPEGRP